MDALRSAKAPQHVPHYYRKLYVDNKLHGAKFFCLKYNFATYTRHLIAAQESVTVITR
jgi:hypothetical protein